MDSRRTTTRQYSEYSDFCQHNENKSTIKIQTPLGGGPLRSDGMDETGDANQTLVWVTHRTTGRGIQTMIGHSHSEQNSRRAANVELGVGLPSIVYLKTGVHRDNRWDIPRKRALFTSDGPDSTTSGSDIPEGYADKPPEEEYSEGLISRRPQDDGGTERLYSPSTDLEKVVIQLQKEVDDCRTELEIARKQTPAVALRPPSRSGFTSTPVPRYGESNWEQYREVFEAIVSSNGWNGVTAALQLLSHLDGDALNVALLIPESRRVVPGFIRSLQHSRASGRIQASVSAGIPASGG